MYVTKPVVNPIVLLLTSVWCFRSSSTRSSVSFRSSGLSTLDVAEMVLIFMRCIGAENSVLKENESSSLISREGGCFFNTLYFAHASDCSCRLSSCSGISVALLISYTTNQSKHDIEQENSIAGHLVSQDVIVPQFLEQKEDNQS